MQSDSFKPEEGGEIEVINPDEGNNTIEAQPEEGDAFAAAELEALEELEATSEEDEATEEEVEPEQVEEDLQAEPDQAEPESQVETQEDEPQAVQWDGNPATLPETLKPAYQLMLKGFHQKTRELADARRETQELNARLLLRMNGDPDSQQAVEGPPPLPTGDSVTAEQWEAALDKRQQYWSGKALEEARASGQFVTAEQYQPLQQQAHANEVMMKLQSLPGFNDSVAGKMAEIAETDPSGFWAEHVQTANEAGLMQLASLAMSQVQSSTVAQATAKKAAEKTQRKATAASRATPRVTSPSRAAPEDVFAKTLGMTQDEKMAYAEKQALEDSGG